jgi:aldehyde:ferredoxin oxidoreductase
MPGFTGKILRVDLSSGEITIDTPPESFYRRYMGGRGLAVYYLLREVPLGSDAFDPANLFILAPGVLTGTPLAGASRAGAASISPLTGGLGSAEGGGYWPAELKRAGWDAIIVKGRAPRPVWLWIQDEKVEIRDGSALTGKTTGEVEAVIRAWVGAPGDVVRATNEGGGGERPGRRLRIAQCGPAAERGVRYANVVFDLTHFAGRCGNGAVMASKNLRAVAVRGSRTPEVSDPTKVKELVRYMATTGVEENKDFSQGGTPRIVLPLNAQGGLPTRNFRQGDFEDAAAIDGTKLGQSLLSGTHSCYACPLGCKRNVSAEAPYAIDPAYGGPEYETLGALGSCCGVADLAAICKGNELCAAYGLDTISTGVAIAFAMESYELGLLDRAAVGGLDLRFGNGAAMVEMIERIARREGLGELLGEGVARAAERIGGRAGELAMHVKGQEVPMHEPRLKHGLGLGYEVSPTGADHCHNIHDTLYAKSVRTLMPLGILETVPADDLGPAKVRLFFYKVNWQHFLDSAVMCTFVSWSLPQMVEMVRAVTGWNTSLWELEKVGERVATLARLLNLRRGLGAATDRLPRRFFEPFKSGPLAGVAVREEALVQARRLYYAMAGWDEEGRPTRAKLSELDLDWALE